jgi:predicted nuclease of predicted toxin-antitoxin system
MIRILLDQGLPRSAADRLRKAGADAVHAGECGLATALDQELIRVAREQERVIVTLDADFHALLALSGTAGPSVVRLRIEGLRAEALANLVLGVLESCESDLRQGSLVTVTENQIRIHHLPIGQRKR